MNLKKTLKEYYSQRAQEYDAIYHRPNRVRMQEQKFIADYIAVTFKGRFVLELACGTGFWTRYLLKSARKILSTDYSGEMLEVVSNLFSKNPRITFLQADAYNPPTSYPKFDAAMANFWFSHIPKKKIKKFLETLHTRLSKNSVVMFVDNTYMEEVGGELITKSKQKDTFKRRILRSGEKFDILKNYYNEKQLKAIFSKYSKNLEIKYLTNFWIIKYFVLD